MRRQQAVGDIAAPRRRPQIRPWPFELVELGQDHPGAFAIQAKARLGGARDFDGEGGIGGWPMRHRQDRDDGGAGFGNGGQQDGAGPVLAAVFMAGLGLMAPQIGVADDEARNRIGKRQGSTS